MNLKQATFSLIFLSLSSLGIAQNNFAADRPGLSYTTTTLGTGSLQYQTSLQPDASSGLRNSVHISSTAYYSFGLAYQMI